MLNWVSVSILIVLGLILIIVELIFVPGTTIIGILGFIFAGVGIYLSFVYYGVVIGSSVLGGFLVVSGVALYVSFKGDVWKKFALKSSIDSRVNDDLKNNLMVGDYGIANSSLRPNGKAEFNEKIFEVRSNGRYVDTGEKVKIIKIESNRIIVEPLN
jgi:membrane-bound ClpP family serine protease